MTKEEILQIVKTVITEEIEKAGFKVQQIILFGSRAKGDERQDSDWDFYIVVDKDIDFRTKQEINKYIRRRLVAYGISVDILIQSKRKTKDRKNDTGYLTYYILREGLKI